MQVEFPVMGKGKLSCEVDDLNQAFDFLAQADVIFGVTVCGNCESDDLSLMHKTPKKDGKTCHYYSIKCKSCRHELKFGITQDDGRLFPKGWEPPYEGGNGGGENVNQDQDQGDSRQSQNDNRKKNRGF